MKQCRAQHVSKLEIETIALPTRASRRAPPNHRICSEQYIRLMAVINVAKCVWGGHGEKPAPLDYTGPHISRQTYSRPKSTQKRPQVKL